MKSTIRILFILFIANTTLTSQVAKRVVVEHFTNTKCPICKSRNPGFYNNLSSQPGVLHLAIHPSSPYASCLLSQQNNPDNDNRTKYYGVYGGTPRLVIQGKVIPASDDYNSPDLFAPFLGTTSPIEINIKQAKYDSDSIHVKIIIKAVASNTLSSLRLFAALVEDTLFYASPNGETEHYDVYRKSLFGATGLTISVPAIAGDSVIYEASSSANVLWNFSRIYTLALVQDISTKEVIQVNVSSPKDGTQGTTSTVNIEEMKASVYPNPAKSIINIRLENNEITNASLFSIDCSLIQKHQFSGSTSFDIQGLAKGFYIVELSNSQAKLTKKIQIQ